MTTLKDKLCGLVQEYSDLGFHRTGTPVDQATIEWFERQLSIIGARVERAPYGFQRHRCLLWPAQSWSRRGVF